MVKRGEHALTHITGRAGCSLTESATQVAIDRDLGVARSRQ